RRHTRCYRDWSSDVCSSDLEIFLRVASVLARSWLVCCRCTEACCCVRPGENWMVRSVVLPRRTILFLGPELSDLHFPPDGVLFVAPEDCFSPGVVAAVDFFSVDPA